MISSHLTPEPERRLWLISENIRRRLEVFERNAAILAAFCAAQIAFIAARTYAGSAGRPMPALLFLAAAVLVAGAAFFPQSRVLKWLPYLDAAGESQSADDSLIFFGDIAKYTHGELSVRLDKYFGGGITGTPYYEDLVGRIVVDSRLAVRKYRLLRCACAAAGLGQAFLIGAVL